MKRQKLALRIDDPGALKSVSLPRWGNPSGQVFRYVDFGGVVEQEACFLKAMLGVPLFAGGAVRGVLHVGRRRPRQFEASDIRLLPRVAERVAAAIEDARAREARPGGQGSAPG